MDMNTRADFSQQKFSHESPLSKTASEARILVSYSSETLPQFFDSL